VRSPKSLTYTINQSLTLPYIAAPRESELNAVRNPTELPVRMAAWDAMSDE